MPTARWNGAVIAEAPDDKVQVVEENIYFPADAVHQQYLQASDKVTLCPWKGSASYYDVVVKGERNKDAALTYATPKEAAKQIAGYIAFQRGVEIEK